MVDMFLAKKIYGQIAEQMKSYHCNVVVYLITMLKFNKVFILKLSIARMCAGLVRTCLRFIRIQLCSTMMKYFVKNSRDPDDVIKVTSSMTIRFCKKQNYDLITFPIFS